MSNQCQKCGKEIEENVLLCEECNVPEPNFGEPVIEKKKKAKRIKLSKPKIIAICLVVVIVLFFGMILARPAFIPRLKRQRTSGGPGQKILNNFFFFK